MHVPTQHNFHINPYPKVCTFNLFHLFPNIDAQLDFTHHYICNYLNNYENSSSILSILKVTHNQSSKN